MALFDFLNVNVFHKERAEELMEKLLKDEFIYQLKKDNSLTITAPSGQQLATNAVTMDKKRNSLIVAEKTSDGIMILERNDPVQVMTQVNDDHEVYSFHSKVSNIILDDGEILYEIVIPGRLEKGQRRNGYRVNIESDSLVKIMDSVYEGRVKNLSSQGVLFTLDGYWPENLDEENPKIKCNIDMDFMQLDCQINIRYVNFEPYPGRKTFVGGRLQELNSSQQHQLNHFLSAQQRIQQRQKAELKYGL
jgi:c-di-GMP-binding flagellar brake protein YcgR